MKEFFRKRNKRFIGFVCCFAVLVLCIMFGVPYYAQAADDKPAEGSWLLSDERLEGSGYQFELAYRMFGGDAQYLYVTPKTNRSFLTLFNNTYGSGVLCFKMGSVYTYIQSNDFRIQIQGGLCHVKLPEGSFVTNEFSLRELPDYAE